jgi:hypothetical protein
MTTITFDELFQKRPHMGQEEIENYVFCPVVITRYLNNRRKKGKNVTVGEVERILDGICESLTSLSGKLGVVSGKTVLSNI